MNTNTNTLTKAEVLNRCNGRGSADSYYHRSSTPHYYTDTDSKGRDECRVSSKDMTSEQIKAYHRGYDSIDDMDRKDWG